MKIELFENFLNESSSEHKIGDSIESSLGHLLACRKEDHVNKEGPKVLFGYSGYHPNISMVTGLLTITGEDGDSWILNDGKYQLSKQEAREFESVRQRSERTRKIEIENAGKEKQLREEMMKKFKVGDKLIARMDINREKPHVNVPPRLTERTWKGVPFAKKGGKKTIRGISDQGMTFSGFDRPTSFLDIAKFFEV